MKIGKPIFLFFLLLTFILSGCAMKDISKDYRLNSSKKTGVAVVSLSFSGLSRPHRLAYFYFDVHLQGVGNDFKKQVSICGQTLSADWNEPSGNNFISKDKPVGRLAVIELPEGEYEFYSWDGGYAGSGGTSKKWSATEKFSRKFKVVPGKAVYLGNICIHVYSERYLVEQKDLRDRDLPLLYQKYPLIKSDQVLIDIK